MKEILNAYCEVLQAQEKNNKVAATTYFKSHLYTFFHSITANCYIPHYIYFAFMVIEAVQLSFPLIFTGSTQLQVNKIVLFVSFPSTYLSFWAYACFILVIWAICAIFMLITKDARALTGNSSILYNVIPKVLGYLLIVYDCILFFPGTLAMATAFNCTYIKGIQCSSSLHVVIQCVAAIIGAIALVGEILLALLINTVYEEPGIPISRRNVVIPIIKIGQKLCVVFALITQNNIAIIISLTLTSLCAVAIIILEIFTCYYTMTYLEIGCQVILSWHAVFKALGVVISLHLSPYVLWIPNIFIIWALCHFKSQYACRVIAKFGELWVSSEYFTVQCINNIIDRLSLRNKSEFLKNNLYITGIISAHRRVCAFDKCKCDKEFTFALNEKNNCLIKNRSQSFSHCSLDAMVNIKEKGNKDFKIYVSAIILDALNQWEYYHDRSISICILKCIFNDKYLSNKYRALYELSRSLLLKPSFIEGYAIYSLKSKLHKKYILTENREQASSKFSLHTIMKYHTAYIKMYQSIVSSLAISTKFWNELILSKPSFQKIMKYSDRQFEKSTKIRNIKLFLESLFSHDIRGSVIYTLYLSIIEQDKLSAYEQALKVKSQLSISKLMYDESDKKYGPNSSVSVAITNGNEGDIGKIIDTNNEFCNLFGYPKSDTIDTNISCLMPSMFSKFHDENILRSLSKSDHDLQKGLTIEGIAMHARGYIFPVSIIIKITYNMTKGIVFTGFIKLSASPYFPKDSISLLLDNKKTIEGFNLEFLKSISGNSTETSLLKYIASEKKLNIARLYPNLFVETSFVNMCSSNGIISLIDLSILKANVIKLNGMSELDELNRSSSIDITKDGFINGDYLLRIKKITNEKVEYMILNIMLFSNQSQLYSNKIEDVNSDSDSHSQSKKASNIEKAALEENNMNNISVTTSNSTGNELI